ncbi:alkaline phosphatase D family protein [Dongia sedimenti]|uniref:Alkaline phosphatase D family protein n=1 Tax=Dongia sedimenti TaxID=3064282 RepID=A0ABU0YMJ2_9PROT|nr:alkaline phosphatase D family protein [Rhodospirillaceae bacterium R-7]
MTDQGIPLHETPGPSMRPSIGRRSHLSRRQALGLGLAALAQPLLARPTLAGGRLTPPQSTARENNPFPLGVASGDPLPDGFVLWTRLAPEPLSRDPNAPGGLSGGDILLHVEIAEDPLMHRIVRRGLARAEAAFAHSVHLEVAGLKPGRPYWYRFMTDEAASPIGCARTAPSEAQALDHFRFGFVSCSNYEQGYFSAYRHLAAEAPDLVLFLGDYIYETVQAKDKPSLRRHSDGEIPTTLTGYRNRYAQYRLDPDLQALHEAAPALVIWDDHEVQNDYAGEWASNFEPPARFLQQRAAAYQAFYEHMPLRPSRCLPQGGGMRIYDRTAFGDLVSFSMLDGRQYRSREACYAPPYGGGHVVTAQQCPELIDPARSLLGKAQEAWLYDGLAQSRARWNVIGQTVLMAPLHDNRPGTAAHEWTEAWDGYPAARARLLDHIESSGVANPVVLSGDNHAFWANELKREADGATIATEFVGTSITSYGPPYEQVAKWLPENPQVKFFESRKRGYTSVEVNADRMVTRFQAISDAADPDAGVSTLASFVIEAGRKGVETA